MSGTNIDFTNDDEPYYDVVTGKVFSGREARAIFEQTALSGHEESCPNPADTAVSVTAANAHEDEVGSSIHPCFSSDVILETSSIDENLPNNLESLVSQLSHANQQQQELTPEQRMLIATPDRQQQKLIEDIRRAKELKLQQQQGQSSSSSLSLGNLQQIGADFKKFIEIEKEKTPLQWGVDLGKFIEEHSGKRLAVAVSGPVHTTNDTTNIELNAADASHGDERSLQGVKLSDSPIAVPSTTATTTLVTNAPSNSPTFAHRMKVSATFEKKEGVTTNTPSNMERKEQMSTFLSPTTNVFSWSNMPPLSTLNGNLLFPGSKATTTALGVDEMEPVRISAILWKRRSGFGKLSATKAWEKRRVELRGTKLVYYETPEEVDEQEKGRSCSENIIDMGSQEERGRGREAVDVNNNDNQEQSFANKEHPMPNAQHKASSITKSMSIFEQATQAAMAMAAGIEAFKHPSSSPRGILDIVKDGASIAASTGHSGAPTPFCISIKVKSETKWKFCFDTHGVMMEWLAALTDVVVRSSVQATMTGEGMANINADSTNAGLSWHMEEYFLIKKDNNEVKSIVNSDCVSRNIECVENDVLIPTTSENFQGKDSTIARSYELNWSLNGFNLKIAWALMNCTLFYASFSSLSIVKYLIMMILTNFAVWKLCTCIKESKSIREKNLVYVCSIDPEMSHQSLQDSCDKKISSYLPMAGSTTLKVSHEKDSNINKDGIQLPSWLPVSSSDFEVRSYGYSTTKKKVPSPGELYECIAVDCFASEARFPDVALRVVLPKVTFVDDCSSVNTWKSPDIFVVSISIPTEPPKFGRVSEDGPGTTIICYFKMKDETRAVLRRITADGYESSADQTDSDIDVQCRLTNGIRLWEKYCEQAPTDPLFQARFKLIPQINLSELGCPSYISKYNSKPVLIKRNEVTGFLSNYPSLNAMEFDINLHPFPYLFKQATAYLKENLFDKGICSFGFVIEGRSDEELPEVLIGAMKICYPSPKYIISGEDLFTGRYRTSLIHES